MSTLARGALGTPAVVLGRLVRGGFLAVLGSQGFTRILMGVQGVVLARILGPEDLGRFALLASVLSVAGVVGQGGIPSALARYVPLCEDAKAQARLRDGATGLGMALSVVVGLALAWPPVGVLLTQEAWVRRWLVVGVALVPMQTVSQACLSTLHGQGRLSLKAGLEATASGLALVGLVTGALAAGLEGAAVARVASTALVMVTVAWVTGWRPAWPRAASAGFWRFATLSMASACLSTALHTVDTLILGVLRMPVSSIGAYRVATLASSFVAMVPAAAMHTLFPQLVRATAEPGRLRALARSACLVSAGYGVVAGGLGLILAPGVVPLLAGRAFQEGVPFFRVLCVGLVFRPLVLWAGSVILASGRPGLNLCLLVVTGALSVVLNLALVKALGPLGAAWASAATEAAGAAVGGIAAWHVVRSHG